MAETHDIAVGRENLPAAPGANDYTYQPVSSTESEIDIQIRTARAHPRDMANVKQRITDHISDPDIAESMWYTLKRGGETIVGPSIRLAEILYTAWGNIRVVSSVVETTATHCTARGVAIDLENNTGLSSDATVPIYGKGPEAVKLAHMRAQAVARRNVTFQVIPGVYQRQAMKLAQRVYSGQDITVRRDKMLAWFQENGVTEATVLDTVGLDRISDLTTEHLETLRGMANKIVDEQKAPAKAMGQMADAEAHATAEESIAPAPMDTLLDTDAEQNALVISAKKKFGKQFKQTWDAACAVAGDDYGMLRRILTAPTVTVGAALMDDDPKAALRDIAGHVSEES